jgi:hypothetical protein
MKTAEIEAFLNSYRISEAEQFLGYLRGMACGNFFAEIRGSKIILYPVEGRSRRINRNRPLNPITARCLHVLGRYYAPKETMKAASDCGMIESLAQNVRTASQSKKVTHASLREKIIDALTLPLSREEKRVESWEGCMDSCCHKPLVTPTRYYIYSPIHWPLGWERKK